MEATRPILYGVADYARIRKTNAWFIDRTAKIRDLEQTAYAVFLRPRRFGKSFLVSLLEYYYDIAYSDRFEALFGGTDIGATPTEEHNSYLVLSFDFSAVPKDPAVVQREFDVYVGLCCDTFARKYAGYLPEGLAGRILAAPDITKKLNEIFLGMRSCERRLYVFIDEYDNFTNTILAESGLNAYNELCHGDGVVKQFFTLLKTATGGTDAPVSRLFVTGVSPVTMDDVTSGFNIGTNISLDPVFADLTGFRHEDLRAIAEYYASCCGFDADRAFDTALRWYDNYRFGDVSAPSVANTTIVLSFFGYLWRVEKFPDDLIDENLRTDYAKIRRLVTLDNRLNGNFHILEKLIAGGTVTERMVKSFQARELTKPENFTSLLYWLGITTVTGRKFEKTEFGVPNETLKRLAAKMIPEAYSDIHKIDEHVYDINGGLCDFAENGEWRGFAGILSEIVEENFGVRDGVDGEKVVQSSLVALLAAAGGPYFTRHERESGGGFYDIVLAPQLSRWPEIAHAALIELKYVKAGDAAPTPEQLAKIRSEAVVQLDRYSADPVLLAEWQLKPGGHVTLHRLVFVFHGGECVLQEEV